MNEFKSIGRFGVANVPPQSNAQQTATYTTSSWAIDVRVGPISMFAKQPASENSVELPTSSVSPSVARVKIG